MADGNATLIADQLGQLSFQGASAALQPLIIFVIGMVIYAIFVHKFYKFISRRDIFNLGGRRGGAITYVLTYVVLFPIAVFLWFFIISALLGILSTVLNIGEIFMISMALTATIRITAYYDEDLSHDIAQLVPFSLLAIFLLDISQMSFGTLFNVLYQIPSGLNFLVYYMGFIVILEIVLRLVFEVEEAEGIRHQPSGQGHHRSHWP
jgi:hypothetical protein